MSALTKVFVVLVTVLSVALLALLVPLVSNQQNYKAQVGTLTSRLEGAERTAKIVQSELGVAQAGVESLVKGLKDENAGLQGVLTTERQARAEAEGKAIAEKARADKIESTVATLTSTSQQLGLLLQANQEELKQRREDNIKLGTQATELAAKNNDLSARIESQERLIRRNKEVITATTTELETLMAAINRLPDEIKKRIMNPDTAGVDVPSSVQAPVDIAGQIVIVDKRAGETFAQINVGKADGVVVGNRFMVSRGNAFLGYLVVTKVDDRSAAGKINLEQAPINKGDKVMAGPQL